MGLGHCARQHDGQVDLAQPLEFQALDPFLLAEHVGAVQFAALHRLQRLEGQALLQLQADLRMPLGQLHQHVAQPQRHRIDHRAEAHQPLRRAADLLGGRADAGGGVQRALGLVEQAPAGLGQLHAARRALEQLDAELVLQRLQLCADGRGAGEYALGRLGQVAFLRDGGEGLQLIELHGGA